jgi:hypothetical protein
MEFLDKETARSEAVQANQPGVSCVCPSRCRLASKLFCGSPLLSLLCCLSPFACQTVPCRPAGSALRVRGGAGGGLPRALGSAEDAWRGAGQCGSRVALQA